MKASLFIFALVCAPAVQAAPDKTNCRADEAVYFSCGIEGSQKVVSLCGDTSTPSWAQYRFGAIGHPELIYPKTTAGSLAKFAGFFEAHKAIPLHTEEVWFRISKYRYRIESSTSELNNAEPTCSEAKPCINNALVITDGKQVTVLPCAAGAVNNLTQLRGRISDDQSDR